MEVFAFNLEQLTFDRQSCGSDLPRSPTETQLYNLYQELLAKSPSLRPCPDFRNCAGAIARSMNREGDRIHFCYYSEFDQARSFLIALVLGARGNSKGFAVAIGVEFDFWRKHRIT